MKNLFKLILLTIVIFVVPKISFGQFIQWLGTKDNIVDIRNILRSDSAIEFPLTDTSKHPTRPGRLTSFNGDPYWWNGIYWAKLRGDTTTAGNQVNSDWTATTGVALILHKPTLAAVATTGSYTDLSNKPTIPAAQIQTDWNASSGITSILNKPRMIDSIWKDLDSIRIRVRNNDNSFRTFAIKDSIGSGGGSGTVVSVGVGNLTPIFGATITGSPTVNPTISFTLSNAAAHKWLGNPNGSAAAPGYNFLTVADLPTGIPLSNTLIAAGIGISPIINNSINVDTLSTIATIYDVSLKQDKLNGTGYLKQNLGASTFLTPTQVTADLNTFTTTLKGLVPAPSAINGFFLGDDGGWHAAGSGSGAQSVSGDATGTLSGTNIPLVLATVNSTPIVSSTLVKQVINAKGLTTNAVAVNAGDITGILGYNPLQISDTLTKLATKSDLAKLDTIKIIPSPSTGTAPIAIYGRNDSLFAKRFINAIQNNDSSITVGNMIAANNLNDVANKNSALNTILPSQTGNANKILSTDGTNTSWITNSGGSGTTNLGNSTTGNSITITSSSGTPTTIPSASHVNAGPISAASQARIDSIVNIANTRVGDSLVYTNLTLDTIYLKGIDATSLDGSLIASKNHTQQKLSYDFVINPAHSNTFTASQTFGQVISTGNVFLSATVYQASNGKLDYIIQDTTTGRIYRTPYIPIDSSGAQNGYVLTWNTTTGKATFVSPGSGGTLTNFSAGTLSPLFTTSVATSTTTPALTFTLTNAPANSVFGSVAGGAPSYFNPSLTSSLFANEGTPTTVLKGNNAGNPTFGSVVLTTDVSGQLPTANAGVPSGGTTGQGLVKNSSTNYDYSWTNTINSIVGTTNQINVSTVAGVSTISAPQNLHTGANVIFNSATLGGGDLALGRTDQAIASITRPNTTGAKSLQFSVVGGGPLDLLNIISNSSTFSGSVSITGATTHSSKVTLGASSTSGSSLNFPIGVSPTTPVQGDEWATSGHLFYRDGSTTYDLLASSGGITSLNGINTSTQSFATGASGTDFNISSVGSTHTFNIPDAGNAVRGVINAGSQSIYGTKTFISAPILTNASTTNQVWTANNNAGAGGWSNPQNIFNNNGTISSNRTVSLGTNSITFASSSGGIFNIQNTNESSMNFLSASGVPSYSIGRSLLSNDAQDFFIYDAIASANRFAISSSGKVTIPNTLQITDGTQGAGKILMSDASGNASWQVGGTASSGNYTPTYSVITGNVSGITGNVRWSRAGNEVTLSGNVAFTNNTSGTVVISLTLPFPLTAAANLAGVLQDKSNFSGTGSGYVEGNGTTLGDLVLTAPTGARTASFVATYTAQ
jgi:hypothetical protein